jgi:predicted CopG family antitoxin
MRKLRKNISISESTWEKLQELAKKENRSASNFIEYLIEKWEKGE